MGLIFAAGYGPECLERWTWDQIAIVAECLAINEAERVGSILRPLAGALGADVKQGGVEVGGSRRKAQKAKQGSSRTRIDHNDADMVARAKARDARIIAFAGKIPGISVVL